ncbi:hypothetical protein [Pseudomonas sp. 11/12A]|uniref:hypothetical protein n=1 Tax=Pseudomonas sp. 11/12A TaxID=1506582 RepID=UPI001F3AEEF7|nr:hypothetical protein [Pseudomonas sp. 11/12A]
MENMYEPLRHHAENRLQILPNAGAKAGVFVPVLNTAMGRFQIVGAKRVAAFIAQIGHERRTLACRRHGSGQAMGSTPWLMLVITRTSAV